MKLLSFIRDTRAATAVEFGLTAPAFFAGLMAAFEIALLLWTQLGLQHGAEMAARCASVNSAICGNTSATQSYAVSQAFGLSVPASTFSVATVGCGSQVTANYDFGIISGFFGLPKITLKAKSCFPK
jgi:Flp pilus assembly protein TadG